MTRKLTRLGCHFILRSPLKLVSGSMNREKCQTDIILNDIKMLCEYVAFPCSIYLSRPKSQPLDKVLCATKHRLMLLC